MNNYIDDLKVVMGMVDRAVLKPKYTYAMHENAPRKPRDSYAVVRLRKTASPGTDVTYDKVINNQIYQVVEGIKVLSFDIMFNRDGEESAWFESCFNRRDIIDYLSDLGYGILSHGEMNELDLTRETTWEVRTGFTLDLSVVRRFYLHPDMIQFGKGTHHQATKAEGGAGTIEATTTEYKYNEADNEIVGTIVVDKDGIIPPTT